MASWIPFAVFVGVFALAVGVSIRQGVLARRRTEQLGQVAVELGFEFLPGGDQRLLGELEPFHLFSQGRAKTLWNLMRGSDGMLEIASFDYRYTVGSGKSRRVLAQSVVCLTCSGGTLPRFCLRPENLWHKIGTIFGYQDIDFPDHPSFSQKYLLRGGDETAIRAVFTRDVLEFFERRPPFSAEAGGSRLIIYRELKLVPPEQLRDFLEEGLQTLRQFRGNTEAGGKAQNFMPE